MWRERDGTYWFTARWFLIPEETSTGRQKHTGSRELFRSSQTDNNEVFQMDSRSLSFTLLIPCTCHQRLWIVSIIYMNSYIVAMFEVAKCSYRSSGRCFVRITHCLQVLRLAFNDSDVKSVFNGRMMSCFANILVCIYPNAARSRFTHDFNCPMPTAFVLSGPDRRCNSYVDSTLYIMPMPYISAVGP